jgi:hypothetical protein
MNMLVVLLVTSLASGGAGWLVRDIACKKAIAERELQQVAQAEQSRLLRQANVNRQVISAANKRRQQGESKRTIERKVDEIPHNLPMLPPEFRVLHDAAATGKVDDPTALAGTPVAAKTVARTLADNYTDARSNAATLEELQAVVRASGCFDLP